MKKLARLNRGQVLDLLGERLAFERTGVRLYESILERAVGAADPILERAVPKLAKARSDENEHAAWLEEQIRSIGGDPGEPTPSASLVWKESLGLVSVVMDDARSLPEIFHSLLAVELLDHAGWSSLLNLAAEANDDEAQEAMRGRMNEETEHLSFARTIVLAFARRELTGIVTDVSRKAA